MLVANTAQERAINTINGPVIIISCPGSGKTTTLLRRIHHMTESGIKPASILMVTFTKAAAEDMKTRYAKMYPGEESAIFLTIHSFCLTVLRKEGLRKPADIIPESEKRDFMLARVKRLQGVEEVYDLTVDVLKEIGTLKNTYANINKYEPSCCDTEIFVDLYREYEQFKRDTGRIDYEDMMLECESLFRNRQDILQKYCDQFPYIQCDEYQDTNPVQKNILYLLAGKRKNLCVVGDDDQSIYQFRGAKPQIMFDFQKDFAGCEVIMMSTNYRSAQKIVDVSDILIKENKERFKKDFVSYRGKEEGVEGEFMYLPFSDKTKEMEALIKSIKQDHEIKKIPYKDIAILFRTNKQAQMPLTHLKENKIPFNSTEKVKSMYDDWLFNIIKAYALLAFGEGSRHEIMSVLNKPNRYLSYQLFKEADFTYKSMMGAIAPLKDNASMAWKYTQAQKDILSWMANCGPKTIKRTDPPKRIFMAMEALKLDKYIQEYAKIRKVNVEEYMAVMNSLKADAYKFETIGQWFKFAAEEVQKANELNSKDAEGVYVTTMHRSKGQEWKVVYVIDVNSTIVPHRNNTKTYAGYEEERRLLYVAMTRAKDELCVMASGVESQFMIDVMHTYRRNLVKTKYKKPERGALMMHKKFGMGIVTNVTDEKITLDFAGTERTFLYPDALEQGHLRKV